MLFLLVVLSVSSEVSPGLCDESVVSSVVVRVVRLETLLLAELRPVSSAVSLCCWELSVFSKEETRAAIAVDVLEALFDNDVTLSDRALNCVPEGTAKVSP